MPFDPEAWLEVAEVCCDTIPGVDGEALLRTSLNRAYYGQSPSHPEVQKLIDQVRDETLAAGKLVMAPAGSGAAAKAMIDSGIQMIVVQFGQFLRAACDGYLKAARGA